MHYIKKCFTIQTFSTFGGSAAPFLILFLYIYNNIIFLMTKF